MKQAVDPLTAFDAQDRRIAVELANKEQAELRRARINEQSSPHLSAIERLQRWESLHGLRLPADPHHKLVHVIAADTALSAEQVRAEQRRRNETHAVDNRE